MNPEQPESLVYLPRPDGTLQLVAAMYMAEWGTPFDEVPNVDNAPWHTHPDLCWDENMVEVGSTVPAGTCSAGVLVVLPPMLHVWVVDNACGPFAALENSGDIAARALQGGDPNANGLPQTGGCEHSPSDLDTTGGDAGSAVDAGR